MKWIVFIGLFAAAHSAAVYRRSDIPVEVVYEKPAQLSYLRNLQARHQLSPQQREYVENKATAGNRNMEARSQLSPEQVEKDVIVGRIVTPDVPQVETFNKIEENWQKPDQNIDFDIYQKIQEIILNGANNIKSAADAGHFGDRKAEILSSVNDTFEKILENTRNLIDLKATDDVKQEQNQNIIQQIFSTFTNFTSSFTNPQSGAQSDEQPQNPLQAIIGQVQTGIQNVFSPFVGGGSTTQATVLGDNPSTTTQGGPIQFAQNAFQQLQQNFNNFLQPSTAAPGGQGDDVTTPASGPFQAIQNVFSQISQAIPNPFQQQTTKSPSAQNDGTTTQAPNNPLGIIQGVVQGFNPLGQSTAAPSGSSTAAPAGNNPLQGIQSAGQGLLSGVTSGNPAQGIIDQASQLAGGNPLQTGQTIASQIGEGVGQIGSTLTGGKTETEEKAPETVEKTATGEKAPATVESTATEEKQPVEIEKPSTNDIGAEVTIEKVEKNPEENKVVEKKEEAKTD